MFIALSHWQTTKNPSPESKHFPNNDRLVLQFIDLFILRRKYKELSMIVMVSMLGMGFRWIQHTRLNSPGGFDGMHQRRNIWTNL
jgi:hypothetical protein